MSATKKRGRAKGEATSTPTAKTAKTPSKTTAGGEIPEDLWKTDGGPHTARDVFLNLEYGPAPESDDAVKKWIASHNGVFGHFVNNQWVHPDGRKRLDSICPANKKIMCQTIQGTQEDVNRAVAAAKTAQVGWAALSGTERAKHMHNLARTIAKHARIFAVVEALDNGKSFRETRDADVPIVVRWLYHYAGWATLADTEMSNYKPLGVVAAITPWNFPLMLMTWKVCPALAMGNTVVLKPASVTRLSCLLFSEVCAQAGLPPGVFNVVTGGGAMGSMLAEHKDVAKLGFTGSTEIGALLRRLLAGTGKKISLELGGKSPVVVFDTADLDSVVEGVVNAIWFNQGQVCSAGSRLLLQEGIHDKVVAKLKARMDKFRIGHPLMKNIDMGALVDNSQMKTVQGFIDRARTEGLEVYQARVPVPEGGYFIPPTMVLGCSTTSECVREEIFGPVLSVMSFRSPKEAISLANNTKFGLGGSVWTENMSLALEVALGIKAGSVWVNGHNMFDAASGFGGYRESGFGRDGGKEGLYEYVRPKWEERPSPKLKFPIEKPVWPAADVGIPADFGSASSHLSTISSSVAVDRTLKMYIGGKQCRPDGEYSRPIKGPDGKVVGTAADGNRKDIRNAVAAAHKASAGWGKRAAHNRAQICYYIAENLEVRATEFSARIMAQTGRDKESCDREVALSIERLFYYAALSDKFGGVVQETAFYGLTAKIHEPQGVIAILCPDEYPLLGFISTVIPAITRSNTVIVVPSETAPLSCTDLYQIFDTSDLPGGVVNIVTGQRDMLCKTLAEHQDVQAIWYFGNEQVSANIEYVSAVNMKRSWVSYGVKRDWESKEQGQGDEFLQKSIEVKNIWAPIGDTNN